MINYKWLSIAGLFLCLLGCLACEKDNYSDDFTPAKEPQSMENYEHFAPVLQEVISKAVTDVAFKTPLLQMAREERYGDTEVLLADLLDDGAAREAMLAAAEGRFTAAELDQFLVEYPSMIIGVRGDMNSWVKNQHIPPVAYVPVDFNESDTSIKGSLQGKTVVIPLDRAFADVVIALRLSERHDRYAVPYTEYNNLETVTHESVEKDGVLPGAPPVDPPNDCVPPNNCMTLGIESFSGIPKNGCVELSYGFYGTFVNSNQVCQDYLKIMITRLNPNGSFTRYYRTGSDPDKFYDCNVNPNVHYFYTLEAWVSYEHSEGQVVECDEVSSGIVQVKAPPFGPVLNSFIGENWDNSTIHYTWQPPDNVTIWQYRLSYWNGQEYVEEKVLPDPDDQDGPSNFVTEYDFPHDDDDRGEAVRMRIQYRPGAGVWQGDFYDETYASYRNPAQPLYFYGIELSNVELYEQGIENPINGTPEIRIIIAEGHEGSGDDPPTATLGTAIIPTSRCADTDFYYWENQVPFPIFSNSNGDGWSNDLTGSAITVSLFETDGGDAVVEAEIETTDISREHSAQVGFKLKLSNGIDPNSSDDDSGIGVQYGWSQSWKETTKTTTEYPISDVALGADVIYYHEPLMLQRGNRFYGAEGLGDTYNDMCQIFESF